MADLSAAFGLVLDPWQEAVLEAAMGERRDGKWAAQRVGLSVPRQNGKSALVVARAVAGALLFGERLIVVSAHEADTYRMSTWMDLQNLIDSSPALAKRVAPGGIMNAINRERVKFSNGAVIQFKARTGTGGRGFSCDCLMLDEAQIVSAQTWATIHSTMSARENPQIWLTGTPPTPEDDPFAFNAQRESALSGKSTGLAWLEWGADSTDDPALVGTWRKANPSWDTRINHEVVQGEFETYPPERFALERLGIWPQDGGTGIIDPRAWADCRGTLVNPAGPVALVVETQLDRQATALILVGSGADGVPQVRVGAQASGVRWVPGLVADVCAEHPEVQAVVIDGKGPAGPLEDDIREALDAAGLDVELVVATTADYAEACAQAEDAINGRAVRHDGDPVLDTAVRGAVKQPMGDAWKWSRRKGGASVVALSGMSLGLWEFRRLVGAEYDVLESVL